MEQVHCPLCEREEETYLWSKAGAKYVECRHCGLIYENPRLTDAELKEFYSDENYYVKSDGAGQTSGYEDYFSACTRVLCSEYFSLVEKYATTQPGSYLDVGCGLGGVLSIAHERGWKALGIELSHWAAEKGRSAGLNILEGPLPGVQLEENAFDAVSMFDVLEHLSHPEASIREIHRILKPGGTVVVETPNGKGFFASHLYKEKSEIVKPRAHICLFSPDSARRLFTQAGFSNVKIFTFPYCRSYTLGYFKRVLLSHLLPGRPPVQLTWNESLRIAAWK